MAKKKIYAVRKGKSVGIFETWEACKSSVDGYPEAEYKSFPTLEEAKAYLSGNELKVECAPGQVIAYVDGSYDEAIGFYAFGCVMLTPSGEIVRKSGNGNNPESVALRNVTGEMLGAMFAVQWCEVNEYTAIQICYDYTGIEMWATGAWKAKNNLTQKYAAFMKDKQKKLDISFRKIAAHTGDKYNEEADQLAKAALTEGNGVPKIVKE
ncbi:MAG TPA: ribonuclease H family protein [Lachnospiraceae bacterium]|jgi:ribonuclease HI|nr:ribonuclease H family protein [Lachnospiraceae bacterium]